MSHPHRYLICGYVIFLFAGCGGQPSEQQAKEQVTSDVGQASPAKPGASVAFDYELLGEPALGQPLEIRVSVTPAVPADSMSVSFSADASLAIQESAATMEQAEVKAGVSVEHTLVLIPVEEGRNYVNVFASTEFAGGAPMVRTFAIPIQVGTAAEQAREPLETDDEGRPIVSMPGEEP